MHNSFGCKQFARSANGDAKSAKLFSISLYDLAGTDRVLPNALGNHRYDVLRIAKMTHE
jgi:hypothetical protein